MGTYISRKRVERDGRLVAFAGEVMTEVEAKRRGLVAETEKAKAAEAKKVAADEKAAEDAAALDAEKAKAAEAPEIKKAEPERAVKHRSR